MGNPNYPRALGNAAGTLQMIRRALAENRPLDALKLAEAGVQQAVEVLREYPPATVPNPKPIGPENRAITFSTGAEAMLKAWLTVENPVPRECHTCRSSDSEGWPDCTMPTRNLCGEAKTMWVPLNPPKGARK